MFFIRRFGNQVLHALFALVVSVSWLPTARAQFVEQGGKLVGTGAGGKTYQGRSVALSADGNTAIVGGSGDNNNAGAAWVYTRTGGVWSQQGGKLVGTGAVGGSNQGCSVALAADGNTAIVGGYADNNNAGAAWVYTRSGGVWNQQGAKLVGTGAMGNAYQGLSVALSADGNTAIVSGHIDNNTSGAAWVYTRTGGVWSQQGGKLVGTGADGNARQGISVALSADGNTALVGGPDDEITLFLDGNVFARFPGGAAWVYTRSAGVWRQQGGKLRGTGYTLYARQGFSVALSSDGNTAVIGGYADNPSLAFELHAGRGAAWVFTRSAGVWSQQGGKLVGTGAVGFAEQGGSVALSGDGNTAIVGGRSDNSFLGAAWVYTRSGGVWTQQGGKLVGTGAVANPFQSLNVGLSGDGSTAILGRDADNGGIGAAWVFANSGPSIASGGVANGASFLPGIAPGTWVTIRGSNLSATTRTWTGSDFSGSTLPTALDGVSVTINGMAAYVYFISPTQLNVLAPDDATRGPVPVQVTTAQSRSNVENVVEAALAPALFAFSPQGGKYVAAVRADGAYLAPPDLIPGLATVPARPGDTILLFGTGFGPTSPPVRIGEVINSGPLANSVTVRIGGVVAATLFAGIVSPGLYQFNVVVPEVPNGDHTVLVEIGGASSQPNAFVAIQR